MEITESIIKNAFKRARDVGLEFDNDLYYAEVVPDGGLLHTRECTLSPMGVEPQYPGLNGFAKPDDSWCHHCMGSVYFGNTASAHPFTAAELVTIVDEYLDLKILDSYQDASFERHLSALKKIAFLYEAGGGAYSEGGDYVEGGPLILRKSLTTIGVPSAKKLTAMLKEVSEKMSNHFFEDCVRVLSSDEAEVQLYSNTFAMPGESVFATFEPREDIDWEPHSPPSRENMTGLEFLSVNCDNRWKKSLIQGLAGQRVFENADVQTWTMLPKCVAVTAFSLGWKVEYYFTLPAILSFTEYTILHSVSEAMHTAKPDRDYDGADGWSVQEAYQLLKTGFKSA